MIWLLVFGGIALAGLVMVVCYVVWLVHRTADLLSEVAVLADQAGQLGDLLGQLGTGEIATGDPVASGGQRAAP